MKRGTLKSRLLAFLLVLCMVAGLTPVYAVTEGDFEAFAVNETKTVALEPGEVVEYTFTPDEDGNYVLYQPVGENGIEIWMNVNYQVCNSWIGDEHYICVAYDLTAGETYQIELHHPSWYETGTVMDVTLIKATETEGIFIAGDNYAMVGESKNFSVRYTPEFGAADSVSWTVSDENIATVEGDWNGVCDVLFKSAGTFTLTATSINDGSISASIEVTVDEPKTIQVGETVEVNLQPGESVEYNFYADGKAGQYMFQFPRDVMCNWGYGSPDAYDIFDIVTDQYWGYVFDLPEDGHATFNASLFEGEPAVSTTLTMVEAKEATDIVFPNGDTIDVGVGEQVRVPVELVDGNCVKYLQFYVQEENGVAWIYDWCSDFVELYANEVGTTTIVVEANGIYKELTVNVLPYGYDISDEDKWTGTVEGYENITVEYTPEKDGYYFFHHQDVPNLIPAEGGAQPLASFEYSQGGYWGNVYQLSAGQTYTFVSKWEMQGDYAYFVKEVFMAEDFTIPAELKGTVNERLWLRVEREGVFSATYKSSNEDVVLVGPGGPDGVTLFPIAEGTADIIVTDQNGKEKVCTVTVSGKASVQEFYGGENFGLAAGGSITYSFRPWESGLYYIHSGEEAGVDIGLTVNGEALAPAFSYGSGEVYELTAETEYMITVSSNEKVASYLSADVVKEASWIDLGGEETEFYEDDVTGLWFELGSDEEGWIVAETSAVSSDESVIKITSCNEYVVWFEAVGAGTATITVTTHNGLTDSIKITVLERPTLKLNEVVEQTLEPGEGPVWYFTAEKAGDYELTVTTSGTSVFATEKINSQDDSNYVEEIFEAPATKTYKQHMEAGDTWVYIIVNLGEEDIDTTMVLKLAHKLTKVDAVEPTYDAAGNVEYYKCSVCGKLFADAEGKTEVTAESVILPQLIKVEENTAVVSPEAVDKAVEEAAKADEVVIDVSGAEVVEVELPVAALETLVEAEKPLTLVTGDATVTLDAATLAAVTEAANGAEITIRVEQIETKTLNKKQQEAVADREVLVTISANVYAGDEYIGDFKGGKATVKVPLKLEEGEKAEDYTVFFLDDDGKLTAVETFVKNGDIYFVTGHFSEYVVLKNVKTETNPDVPNTGDESNLFMMTTLLVGSLVALAFVALNGKKYAYVGKWER